MSTCDKPGGSGARCAPVAASAAQLLAWLRDPDTAEDALPGYSSMDLSKVYAAMRDDHARSIEICGQEDWPSTLIAGLETLLDLAGPAEGPRHVRHRKRGSTYSVVGQGSLQAAAPVSEGEVLVAYACDIDGKLWFRPEAEFLDGRFEILEES